MAYYNNVRVFYADSFLPAVDVVAKVQGSTSFLPVDDAGYIDLSKLPNTSITLELSFAGYKSKVIKMYPITAYMDTPLILFMVPDPNPYDIELLLMRLEFSFVDWLGNPISVGSNDVSIKFNDNTDYPVRSTEYTPLIYIDRTYFIEIPYGHSFNPWITFEMIDKHGDWEDDSPSKTVTLLTDTQSKLSDNSRIPTIGDLKELLKSDSFN